MAERRNPNSAASSCNTCSRTTESTPPESPTATRLPRRSCARRKARTAASALGGFLELAIAHQALEALFDELLRLLLLHLPQRFDERLLQRVRGRLRIAVRA